MGWSRVEKQRRGEGQQGPVASELVKPPSRADWVFGVLGRSIHWCPVCCEAPRDASDGCLESLWVTLHLLNGSRFGAKSQNLNVLAFFDSTENLSKGPKSQTSPTLKKPSAKS